MLPARQRLDTRHGAAGEVENRLVVQHDLVAAKGIPEGFHEFQPVPRILVVLRRVDLPGSMRSFGGEHCNIRLLEHRFGGRAVVWCEGDPNTGVDAKAHPIELKRLSQCFPNTLRHLGSRFWIKKWGEHHTELVATQARDRSGPSYSGGETRAKLAENVITDVVSKAVVDLLETIEVDHQHGKAVRRRVGLEAHSESLEEEPPVWQPCEVVGARLSLAVGERAELAECVGGPTDCDDKRDPREDDCGL